MSRQVSFSHPWKAVEETEEPFGPNVAKLAGEMGRELPEVPPSSPALRVAALWLLQSSSPPTSSY